MKKHFSSYSLLLVLLFTCISLLPAANISWIGGSGNWDDTANWDTGTIPTTNDHVYIASGTARVYTSVNAISAKVSAGARLEIYPDGVLRLEGAVNRPALTNAGRVYILGILRINDVSSPNGYNGKGIYNTNGVFVYQNALLRISDIEDYAIDNRAPGFVSSNGTTIIEGLQSHGIYNTGVFRNYRDISIYPNITNQSYGIHNRGEFRNYQDGDIYIQYGYVGFLNNTGSSLDNYGALNSYDAQNTGIKNYGTIHNHPSGAIRSHDALSYGLTNGHNGVIDNHQLIECYYSGNTGIRNSGVINNYRSMLSVGYHVFGINLTNGSVFNNYKSLSVTPNISINSLYGFYIRGDLVNYEDGLISISDKIYVVGKLQNHGYMNLNYDGNHAMSSGAEFNNYSVIDDNFDALPSGINNEKLIIKPVSGVMEVGESFDDVLEVESLDDITLYTWKGTPTSTTSVGTYDPNTNSFTPNSNAVGLTTIYIGINNGGNLTRNHTLELSTPVQSIRGKNTPQFNLDHPSERLSSMQRLSVYPNPSAGDITIETKAFENAKTQIQIWNMMGQIVWQDTISEGKGKEQIQVPNEVANGIYLIYLFQNDVKVGVEKIHIQR